MMLTCLIVFCGDAGETCLVCEHLPKRDGFISFYGHFVWHARQREKRALR